jgi:hypothetical protein
MTRSAGRAKLSRHRVRVVRPWLTGGSCPSECSLCHSTADKTVARCTLKDDDIACQIFISHRAEHLYVRQILPYSYVSCYARILRRRMAEGKE